MVTLTTDKGKTHEIQFVVDPSYNGSCTVLMNYTGLLADLAQDFEGVNHFEVNDNGKVTSHDGYSVLYSIFKGVPDDCIVQIIMRKPK